MADQERAANVGDRVFVDIGRGWSEPATVTAVDGRMATVELDHLIEVPDHLGGGWMKVVDREIVTLEPLVRDA